MMLDTLAAGPVELSQEILDRLLHGVGWATLPEVAWVRVTGDDRVRWLNGMVTNSVQSLAAGEGCYTYFLNAQGRIQGDANVFAGESALLLETDSARVGGLMAMLDRFIIMDDVELALLDERAGLVVAGPGAQAALAGIGLAVPAGEGLGLLPATWQGAPIEVVRGHAPLVPRYEVWAEPATLARVAEALGPQVEVSATAFEALRLLEGTPRYGVDIREKELPQETAQARALHFAKGCYLGQEIVERIRSRGQVHRTFAGFVLSGEAPAPGAVLFAADAPDKPIGELTSVGRVPLATGALLLGLGYVRREALERAKADAGAGLRFEGGGAVVHALPFHAG